MSDPDAVHGTDAVLLFSYGTLRQPEVQLATFGRLLEGRAATVAGYRLEWLTITDPVVVATSGSDRHPLLVADPGDATGTRGAGVEGTVFSISAAELRAADDYEVDDYTRVLVPLDTGESAWVYVFAGGARAED
ncbi:gamma-glutamylcyclotransferase family protein [Herbiconiux sp. KACC 21604]|uniref:gamma-glutamylcyclotransferase family protein n=1 Tax=unclassified Herbiconiux TaxID=2618217 RepID=UPI0014930F60|nr:gamma-glutamylcyclotransferase family protein [Herbiconiux sp. SALV-R1]QJU52295.1 gamma-glutamylcyclotransferase [Herbiconiux sp. SALV-R1]WPO87143.1 gamma-glutamylcyclotransferase family protein [Herbiconiux sp. KACC 21604]